MPLVLPALHGSLGTYVMGDRPSNDTSSNRQLENQRINVASVKAFRSECVVTIESERKRERDGEKKRQTDHECIACKELLFCLIFQDARSLQKRLLPSIFAYFIHRFRNEQYVLFRSAKRALFILPDNYEECIRINIITLMTMRYSGIFRIYSLISSSKS